MVCLGIIIRKARLGLISFRCDNGLGTLVRDTACVDNGSLLSSNTPLNDWLQRKATIGEFPIDQRFGSVDSASRYSHHLLCQSLA